MPVESYPWRFSSVISVGSHEDPDPHAFYCNPDPPVEFFARGVDVEVAWTGGAPIRCTGNSFATPHMSGALRARPRQASGADAVPAEERALPDLDERGRRTMSEELKSRSRGGRRRIGGHVPARCSSRSQRWRARSSAPRPRRSSCSTRRPTSSSSRRSRALTPTRCSASASRRARASRAGCSSRVSRSSSRT